MASVYAQYGELLYDFVDATCKAFGDNLVGIYLHGSAAMGCFNPASSDIDLIVVIKDALDFDKRRAYIDDMVRLNARAPKKGLEVSVVRREVCDPFVYPTPFEFHFSPMYLDACVNAPDEYARSVGHSDPDLAAHFTVIRERGRVLLGEGIPAVFGEVDGKYYMDSIWTDVSGAESDILSEPVYIVLNLARVLAYAREGLVLSKAEFFERLAVWGESDEGLAMEPGSQYIIGEAMLEAINKETTGFMFQLTMQGYLKQMP